MRGGKETGSEFCFLASFVLDGVDEVDRVDGVDRVDTG